MRHAPCRRWLRSATAALAFACAGPEPLIFDVRVEVTTHDGKEPVPGALVQVRNEPAATTDALGRSLLRVRGQAGDRVAVSLACPAGTGAPPPRAELFLPGSPSTSAEDAPTLRLACPVASHDAVVLVHAGAAAARLPVKIDGVVVGQTDSLGFAHVHVRSDAPASFEVSLDTSSTPALSPPYPARNFQIAREDQLFVFDTPLKSAPSARKPRRASNERRRPAPSTD